MSEYRGENEEFFNAATTTTNPFALRDKNVHQFLMLMAALKADVSFKFIDYQEGRLLVAETPAGQYWFIFDQNDELVIDQVL